MMSILWLIAMVVFIAVELTTVGLASIWFALGSLFALLASLLGAKLWLQITLFIVVSGASLYFTRPLAQKFLNSRRKATNADRVLSMTGVVKEDIDNILATGVVTVGGKDWSARSYTGEPIPAGTLVRPLNIEGVKLIVVRVEAESEPAHNEEALSHDNV